MCEYRDRLRSQLENKDDKERSVGAAAASSGNMGQARNEATDVDGSGCINTLSCKNLIIFINF